MFTISIPAVGRSPGPFWKEVDQQLKDTMDKHGLVAKTPPSASFNSGTINGTGWRILEAKTVDNGSKYLFKPFQIDEAEFTVEGLSARNALHKVKNHHHPDRPVFFIGVYSSL